MHRITDQIWIGSSQDAKDHRTLTEGGISCILNVAEDLPPVFGWREGIRHFHVGLRDDENHSSLYDAAVSTLKAIVDSGYKVLVHCHEGRSRSVYVTASYMVKHGICEDVDEAIERIRTCGRDCKVHPGHRKATPWL